MGRKILSVSLFLLIAISVSLATSEQNVFAAFDMDTCKSEANDRDPTGTAQYVCTGYGDSNYAKDCTGGSTYGAVFLEPASRSTDSDGLNGLSFKVYGAVFVCNTTGVNPPNAVNIKFNVGSASYEPSPSTSLERSLPSSKWHWGPSTGGGTSVTFPQSVIANASLIDSSDGTYGFSGEVKSTLQGNGTGTKPFNVRFHKIARFTHTTPVAKIGSDSYTNGAEIKVNNASATVSFEHYIKRTDGWGGNLDFSNLYTMNNGSAQGISGINTTDWKTIPDTQTVTDITAAGKQVCSTMKYDTIRGIGGYDRSSDKDGQSQICVTLKLNSITSASTSYASSDVNSAAISATSNGTTCNHRQDEGGSQQANYTVNFSHNISTAGDPSRSAQFNYSIAESTFDGTVDCSGASASTAVGSGSPWITGNGSYNALYSNNLAYRGVGVNIPSFGGSKTVCERIGINPTMVILDSSVAGGGTGSGSGASMTCITIKRLVPQTIYITATSKAMHYSDSQWHTSTPDNIYYDTNDYQEVAFKHEFTNAEGKALATNYTLEFSTDGGATVTASTTGSVTTDNYVLSYHDAAHNNPIYLEETKRKTVCERVKFKPYIYYLHTNGSTEVKSNDETSTNWVCIKVGRPGKKWIDDGEITVTAASSAEVDTSVSGDVDVISRDGKQVSLVKDEGLRLLFTHVLSRSNNEQHTNSPSSAIQSPKEDITDLKYRSAANTAARLSEITINHLDSTDGIGSGTLPYNSSITFQSSTASLFNDNINATAGVVGQIYEDYCQSAYYVSSRYTLRGQYWFLDDEIFSGNTALLDVTNPVRIPRETNGTRGVSDKACVNVARPYNFKISEVKAYSNPEPIDTGSSISANFNIKVTKNTNAYRLTDVPSATIETIGFVINASESDPAENGSNFQGGYTNNSACNFFRNRIQNITSCDIVNTETQSLHGTQQNNSGTNYYARNVDFFETEPLTYVEDLTPRNLHTYEKYCVAIAITPSNSGSTGYGFPENFDNNRTISNVTCANIGKRPNLQVWGASTFTSGGIKTLTTRINNQTYGSWDDFLVISSLIKNQETSIRKMASGAHYISGASAFDNCSISALTIGNSDCGSNLLGRAGITRSSSVERFYESLRERYLQEGRYVIPNETDGNSRVVQISTFSSATVSGKNPIFIYSGDDVGSHNIYIKERVQINNPSFTSDNVPQIIIYAKGDIYIDPGVGTVDAWLVAEGNIYTCARADGTNVRLTEDIKTCGDHLLNLTGPLVAKNISFDRTINGDAHIESGSSTVAEPAELVNLNPYAYFFGHTQASENAQPRTTYLREMPPRY